MKKTKKRGFTIVELVIVIAVIAILAAVLVPTPAGTTGGVKYVTALTGESVYIEIATTAAAED